MKPAEIRSLDDKQLQEKLKECRAELFNKDVARILTEIRARELATQKNME